MNKILGYLSFYLAHRIYKRSENERKNCTSCKNADFHTDLFFGGKGFNCLKQRELEKLIGKVLVETLINRFNLKGNSKELEKFLGETLVEDFFDGKVNIECPLFEEVNKNKEVES